MDAKEEKNALLGDPVFRACKNGRHAILVTGNYFDLHIDNDGSLFYRPLYIAERLHKENNLVLRYSRSSGLSIHRPKETFKNKGQYSVIKKFNLEPFLERTISPTEVIELFRSFKEILTSKNKVSVTVIIDYSTHLTSNHSPSIEERIVAETINDISNLPVTKKYKNSIIVYAHNTATLSNLVKESLYHVTYGYPDLKTYERFFEIMKERTNEFAFTEMSPSDLAKLCRGLQLTQIADEFREALILKKEITKEWITGIKSRLIKKMSNGTLTVLDSNITFDDLGGLEMPKKILNQFAKQLRRQDKNSISRLLFCGPPGTGKTSLASAFANSCGFTLVEFSDSIKSKWVGQSETNLKKALEIAVALSPVIIFIDEIDQSFKSRSKSSNDGGVSAHYLKTLFKFASRDDLRGKIVIVAASNTPHLLDPALINRFVTIPILESTPKQLASIFPKIELRILNTKRLDEKDSTLLEACELLYEKNGSPRQIFDIINYTLCEYGDSFTSENILKACKSYRYSTDAISNAYSSLSAIDSTTFSGYFPWADSPKKFHYPTYLNDIVDKRNGKINELKLRSKLNELSTQTRF